MTRVRRGEGFLLSLYFRFSFWGHIGSSNQNSGKSERHVLLGGSKIES